MRNANVRTGAPSPTVKPRQLIGPDPAAVHDRGGSPAEPEPALNTPRAEFCGAMALQRGGSDHLSAPQGLVQLVGCRDPKIMAEAQAEHGSAVQRNGKF